MPNEVIVAPAALDGEILPAHEPKRRHIKTMADVTRASPGRWRDVKSRGLYLVVSDKGVRRWLYRYTSPLTGRVNEHGLGELGLLEARKRALMLHEQVAKGEDPIHAKREARASEFTFALAADSWIAIKKHKWRGVDNGSQMRNAKLLCQHHAKLLANMPVSEITSDLIQSALAPLWATTPKTAHRALNMWENVMDHARARGWYKGENPARWKGLHEHLSPEQPPQFWEPHHEALPYAEIPEFIRQLHQRQARSTAALALEFLILTASRTSEVLEMEWTEINYQQRVWTMGPIRTMQKQQHRVPLSDRAMALLELREQQFNGSNFVFTGYSDAPLAAKAMSWLLKRRMKNFSIYTVHGFRSSFSDWAHDTTDFAHETIEACLGHSVMGKVAKAYRRGDSIDKRRELMQAWSDYCSGLDGAAPRTSGSL
jgi:integrase